MKALVIPHIQAQHANALQAWWLVGPPSPFTLHGMAKALSLKVGITFSGFSLALHAFQLLGSELSDNKAVALPSSKPDEKPELFWFGGTLRVPQQFQCATYINSEDYVKGTMSTALNPTAQCHTDMTLVLWLAEDSATTELVSKTRRFLRSARLAGGAIVRHGEVKIVEDFRKLRSALRNGFLIADRSDLVQQWMESHPQEGGIEAILGVLADRYTAAVLEGSTEMLESEEEPEAEEVAAGEEQDEHSETPPVNDRWLSANTVGYALLEAPVSRSGVREELLHAFAEPMVGLVQYIPVRGAKSIDDVPVWRYVPDDVNKAYYVST